jgi:hypothetical protein
LARRSKERSVTAALIGTPQVSTDSFVLARVRVALVFSGTARLSIDLLHSPLLLLEIFFRDFHVVDNDVLDATGERRSVVGQDFLRMTF